MRPLVHARAWLALWVLALVVVAVGSLLPPSALPEAPRVSDKLVHVAMYFVLMAAAVQLFASTRALLVAAFALAAFGLALEVAQGTLTTTRMFEWGDVLANTLGVVLGLGLAATPLARSLLWLERRVLPRVGGRA